jgi:hypothetical protein
VRFPSKRSDVTAYEHQRAPAKIKNDNDNQLLAHDGRISPTIIPTRHNGNEFDDFTLHTSFVACELLRGKDTWALLSFFRDNLTKYYDDIIPNNETAEF